MPHTNEVPACGRGESTSRTICLQYPPDYDGELHISVTRQGGHIHVSFVAAVEDGEGNMAALRRIGRDLVRCPAYAKREAS